MNEQVVINMLQGLFSSKGLELDKNTLEDDLVRFKSSTSDVAAYIMKVRKAPSRLVHLPVHLWHLLLLNRSITNKGLMDE